MFSSRFTQRKVKNITTAPPQYSTCMPGHTEILEWREKEVLSHRLCAHKERKHYLCFPASKEKIRKHLRQLIYIMKLRLIS